MKKNASALVWAVVVAPLIGVYLYLTSAHPEPVVVAMCKTVQEVVENNPDLEFLDFVWTIEGSSSLGTNPHLLLEHQPSILLRNQLTISEYDFAMAQLTDGGPVYFFFKDGCIVQTVLLRGGQEA